MDLAEHLDRMRHIIDRELDRLLPPAKEEPKALHEAMRYSVFSEGKRLRPIITVESCKACGAGANRAYTAACAIEMVHTYSLIHDDLPAMDDDDMRRGKPACHKRFGEASAILAGDALLTHAMTAISEEYMKPGRAASGLKIIKELSGAIGSKGMVGGQAMDLDARNGPKPGKQLFEINRLKTAKLFEASSKIGAIAAGASDKKVRAMAEYGTGFGMAFQVIDDIIDGESYTDPVSAGRAYRDCLILAEKAKGAIAGFGKSARTLMDLFDFVLNRAE